MTDKASPTEVAKPSRGLFRVVSMEEKKDARMGS